jgi:ketosteroid isomerase-like protein
MNSSLHNLVSRIFSAVEAKDLDLMMSHFSDDAILIDPHFPVGRLDGKGAIKEGMRGAFAGMQSFGYSVVNYFESENGQHAAVETATHHIVTQGWKLDFLQVFVFDAIDGRITRMQAYEPYGPNGFMGAFLFLARLNMRLFGK